MFYPFPPIVTIFVTEALVLLSQNLELKAPKTMTSFMDDPKDVVPKIFHFADHKRQGPLLME